MWVVSSETACAIWFLLGAEKAAMLLRPHDANGDFLQSGTDTVDTTSQITEASPQELTEDQRAANLRQLMDDLQREAAEGQTHQ